MAMFMFFICSYSDIIIEREVLMQKYIHLVQIVETEKVAANQLRTQLEDQDTEIERLKAEVQQQNTCNPKQFVKLELWSLWSFVFRFMLCDIAHVTSGCCPTQ